MFSRHFRAASLLALFPFAGIAYGSSVNQCPAGSHFTLVVHGGAGGWHLSADEASLYQTFLPKVLQAGAAILKRGGKSVDAVQAAIALMEDSGLLNAGKGAVHDTAGVAELDAAIMDGNRHTAGAVAAVKTLKNPILAARAVMNFSPHVLLVAEGAESFAAHHGATIVDPSYFVPSLPHGSLSTHEYGTVGAVAVDCFGHLAAATSTGGTASKLPGRVGDSPIIGAGTYADDATCAVSGTGIGEYFMRQVAAHDIAARMRYAGQSLGDAAAAVLGEIGRAGGKGGVISVNSQGEVAMPFNTDGMLRGLVREDGKVIVAIH